MKKIDLIATKKRALVYGYEVLTDRERTALLIAARVEQAKAQRIKRDGAMLTAMRDALNEVAA